MTSLRDKRIAVAVGVATFALLIVVAWNWRRIDLALHPEKRLFGVWEVVEPQLLFEGAELLQIVEFEPGGGLIIRAHGAGFEEPYADTSTPDAVDPRVGTYELRGRSLFLSHRRLGWRLASGFRFESVDELVLHWEGARLAFGNLVTEVRLRRWR